MVKENSIKVQSLEWTTPESYNVEENKLFDLAGSNSSGGDIKYKYGYIHTHKPKLNQVIAVQGCQIASLSG